MPVTSNGEYIPPENEGKKKNSPNNNNLFKDIKKLTNEAIASYNTKPKAKPYISLLKFLRHKLPVNQKIRDIFDKLVNHVEHASGNSKQKQHWLYFVERELDLLEWEFNHLNQNHEKGIQ